MTTFNEFWEEAGKKEKKNYILKDRDFYLVFFTVTISSLASYFLNRTDFTNAKPFLGNMFFNYILTAVGIVFFILILFWFAIFVYRFLNRLGTFLVMVWKKRNVKNT